MKYSIPLLLILIISGCNQIEVPESVREAVDSIAFKFVPDKREGICDISIALLKGRKLLLKGETNINEARDEIIRYITDSGYEFYDSLNVIPGPDVADKSWGLISVSVCNMKKSPSHSSELVSQAIMGTPVKVLKSRGGWVLVQTPDHYIGWISSSGISRYDETVMADWRQSRRLIFTARSGDILSPEEENEVVSDIVSGSITRYIDEGRDYYLVETPDGRRGRINKADSDDFSRWCKVILPEADKLIRFAKSLKGSPYLWGGTSTKMADCSGFVKTVYFTGGIILARDASQQFRYGKEVDISRLSGLLEPGDLLFFGRTNSEGEKVITHTGMYIGDTEVIHDSGMIRVNSLDSTRTNYSSYLRESLQGARRIIGAESARGTERVKLHGWYNIQD
ncbi:MAG: C40 family peptidase [Bacteroidales bacterium]|nr:C40 family peptidase [Bacteroidales bacterium]